MLRRAVQAAGALVVVFHLWLFGQQAWIGQLAQADAVLRWLLAAGLVAGLVALARRGDDFVFGRRAVAVWLLAALLHGPAFANDHDGFATPALPEGAATLAQSALSLTALGLTLLGLALLGRDDRSAAAATPRAWSRPVRAPLAGTSVLRSLARPPPIA
jgi:hypothetical protein